MASKIYLYILLVAIVGVSITQVLFKILADKYSDSLFNIIFDYRLYLAFVVYIFAFVIWIVSLSKIDFSVAIPLNVITVVLGGVIGYFLFNETISTYKMIGYFLIISGVLFLSWDAY